MPDEITEYGELVTQMVRDDEGRDRLYGEIDKSVECIFEPSKEITDLPWVRGRHYALTDIADARNAGVRTFSTLLPQINISPNTDEDAEYQRTEMAEQALGWEFERMNRVQFKKGLHEQIVESAVTYHSVCMQTEYLPYKYKGRSEPRIRSLLQNKCFNWTLHHPGSVHSKASDYGLERVAKVITLSAQALIDNFGEDNPGVVRLRQLHANARKAELTNIKYTLVDFMDWTKRVQWAVPGQGVTAFVKSDIVFMDEEHGLPFIPWVIVDYGEPLWKAVIASGIWNNLQHLNLIRFAKAVELSSRSNLVIKTPDGTLKQVWLDFGNPSNPIVAPLGTEIVPISPNPIDPQLENMFGQMLNSAQKSTVSKVLQDIGQYSNAPFSTVSQIVQMALGQLSPAKKTAEAAEAAGFYQMFQWIDHSKIPLVGYRGGEADSKTDTASYSKRGEQIAIMPGAYPTEEEISKMGNEALKLLEHSIYFDLEHLYINIKLQSDNIADEQSRLNVNINAVDKLSGSKAWAWERMGWTNFNLVQSQRAEEVLFDAELQKQVAMKQLEVQEAQMQMQAQQQQQMAQQNQVNQLNAGSQFANMQGQDLRSGGQAAAQTAPFETREAVTGQTVQ